jgi:hypothetical protein
MSSNCPFPPERSPWVWYIRDKYLLSRETVFALYRLWLCINISHPTGFEEICERYYEIRNLEAYSTDEDIIDMISFTLMQEFDQLVSK